MMTPLQSTSEKSPLFMEPFLPAAPEALTAFHDQREELNQVMKKSMAQMQFVHAGNPGGDLLPGELPVCKGLEDDDHDFYCGCQLG